MYVITGASHGLGLALAEILVAKGEKVVCLSRHAPDNSKIMHVMCDLTNEGSIMAAAQAVLKIRQPLKALVNCAGFYSHQPLSGLMGRDVAALYTTNIIGPMLLTGQLMGRITKDSADVLNVASTAGTKGDPAAAAYSSTKWAVRGFTQSLQAAFKGTSSRAISFCPGWFGSESDSTPGMMPVTELATFAHSILTLPKSMEVSEVVINAK